VGYPASSPPDDFTKKEANVNELPSVQKIREDMKSDDFATRQAAYAAYGMYVDAVRAQHVCDLCGWNWMYHDDGDCPNEEQKATLLKSFAKGI
jgi:hypothetical protein